MAEVDNRYKAFENDHKYLKTTNDSDANDKLLQTSISTVVEPKNYSAVSSFTLPTIKQQMEVDKSKTKLIKVEPNLQTSKVFLFQDTLTFPLSTDIGILQNELPIQNKIELKQSSSTRPIKPKLTNTSNMVPAIQPNALLIPTTVNLIKTTLQNIASNYTTFKPSFPITQKLKPTLPNKQQLKPAVTSIPKVKPAFPSTQKLKPTLPITPQLKPFIKPIESIKNQIVYDDINNRCTIELATNVCQRLLSGENIFMCKICDNIYTEHKDLLDHVIIHDNCEANIISQGKNNRESISINNVKKEKENVCQKRINCDQNSAKKITPVIKSTINSKKNKVIFKGECIKCHSVFSDLGKHIKTVHQSDLAKYKVNTHRCTKCNMEFNIIQQLRAHELAAHQSVYTYSCEHCLKYFSCQEDLETHNEFHCSDNMKYLCPYCDTGFPDSNGLRTHLISHIGSNSPEYSISEPVYKVEYSSTRPPEQLDVLFSELDNISEDVGEVYIKQEEDDDNFQVSYVNGNEDNASSQKNLLIDNGHGIDAALKNIPLEDNKVITNEQQTPLLNQKRVCYTVCRICMSIVSYSRIGRHMKKKHNNAAPYQCEICHADFNRKHVMDDHRRKHTNNKPHKCSECSKCFTYKHHRNRHMMIVHNANKLEKLFKCSVCDKAFSFKEYLTLHVNSRHKGKHYMCQMCGKSFSTNAALNKHQLSHTEERPLMCEHCGLTFKCKTHCDTHKKNVHPGEKSTPPEKFECELCKKLFTTKIYRDMHFKRHNGQGHQCDICYKLFVSKAHMKRHIKIMHRNTL